MKIKSYRIVEFFIFLIFINPVFCFLLYTVGVSINFHSVNIIFLFIITILSFLTFSNKKKLKIFQILFILFLYLLVNILVSFYNPINIDFSIFDLIGFYIQIVSPIMIAVFFLKEKLQRLEKFVFKIGIIISIINISQYLLMITDNYDLFIKYHNFLGMSDGYFEDLKALIVRRPLGYFFDVHSQIYLPLFSLLLIQNSNLNKWIRILFLSLIILSIIISGVKTAYMIGLLILIRRIFQVFNFKSIIRILFILGFSTLIIDYLNDSIIFELAKRIIFHDIEILLLHLFEVPYLLILDYPLIFILGGQVFMENFIYSEVYFVTLIFHIGIFGLFVYIIIPNFILYFRGNNLKKDLVLIFILSLSHYYIFKVGINILGTSLIYAYVLNLVLLTKDEKGFSSYNYV